MSHTDDPVRSALDTLRSLRWDRPEHRRRLEELLMQSKTRKRLERSGRRAAWWIGALAITGSGLALAGSSTIVEWWQAWKTTATASADGATHYTIEDPGGTVVFDGRVEEGEGLLLTDDGAVLVLVPAGEELKPVPREGLSLRKTFTRTGRSESESTSEGGSMTETSDEEVQLVVLDVVRSVEDGELRVLERTYEDVGGQARGVMEFGDESAEHAESMTCALEGAVVTFSWDEREQDFVASSEAVDGDVLQDLPWDLDFTDLLPKGAVEEGDSWVVAAEAADEILDPWRGIAWELADEGGGLILADEDGEVVDASKRGELRITYAGRREMDGVSLAVLTIEGELESDSSADSAEEYDAGSRQAHHETHLTRTLEGELLWNVEGGHPHSLTLETEHEGSDVRDSVFTDDGLQFEDHTETELSGATTLKVVFEVVDG